MSDDRQPADRGDHHRADSGDHHRADSGDHHRADSDDEVRAQYEAYPYPARHPADEAGRLISGSPSHILELNHYVFAGRRDFAEPLRVLVAGGGTGDATIMLAQQLADAGCPAEVVYVDVSEAARAVAEARPEARNLRNVRFHTLSVEALPDSGLGPFDYIDCCGVLHHLEDPARGLAILAGVLAADGGLGVMLYGALGRTGVYDMQAMMGVLAGGEAPGERVRLARVLLADLPSTNRLKRNPFVADHIEGGDAGLFDLFLHARDRAYRVPEIAALAATAGLRITAFVEPARYDPDSYLGDAGLIERLKGLPWIERCAFAELLAGNMRKHVFYAVKADNAGAAVAAPNSPDAVPCLRDLDGPAFARDFTPGAAMTATIDGATLRFPLPPLAPAMVARMDGRRTIGAIHGELANADPQLDWDRFQDQFQRLFAALNGLGKLYLRYPPKT